MLEAGASYSCCLFPVNANISLCIARDLTLEAAQSAGSSRSLRSLETSRTPSSAQIKKLLDSRNDREILDGLRKVISVWKWLHLDHITRPDF